MKNVNLYVYFDLVKLSFRAKDTEQVSQVNIMTIFKINALKIIINIIVLKI